MLLWLFIAFLASANGDNCPLAVPTVYCSSNTIFVFDTTNFLTNTDIQTELNYAWFNLLPSMAYGKQLVTFVSYGSGSEFTPLTSLYSLACSQMSNLMFDAQNHGGQTVTLTSTMNQLYQDYRDFIGSGLNIQLFSGSTDSNDINLAAMFVRNNMPTVSFTVVSLSGYSGYWNSFPYTELIVTTPWNLAYNGTTSCLLTSSCGDQSGCRAPTTTTVTTSTKPTTTTTPPLPSTTQPQLSGTQCSCNYQTVWNDVMFLFDASSLTGPMGLQELLGYVQTSFSFFNIQRASWNNSQFHTRAGIITYGATAQLQYPLGSFSGSDLQNLNQLPYSGGSATNLNAAIDLAWSQLQGNASRSNARPVIVVLASSFNPTSADPTSEAQRFRDFYGGAIVVYEFNQPHSPYSPVLRNLTYPGYYILNTEDNGHRMQDAMCDANCRCLSSETSFSSSLDIPDKPSGGCFNPVATLGNFQVASNKCTLLNNGTIAMGKTAQKTAFLESLLPPSSNYLAGMKWDNWSQRYYWVDGTPVSGSYQPWYSGASNHQSGSDCVFVYNVAGSLQWVNTDCRNGFFYVCETAPCDSLHYCS